jgi:two-component system response regulator
MHSDWQPSLWVIDDEEDQAYLVELAAKRLRAFSEIVVETASRTALAHLDDRIRTGARLPDLILMDWKMPCMGGSELIEAFKSRDELRGVPIVVVSSSVYERDRFDAEALGCRAFVQKPGSFEEYIDLLRANSERCQPERQAV